MVLETITYDTKNEDLRELINTLEWSRELDLEIRKVINESKETEIPLERKVVVGGLITKLYGPKIPKEFSRLIHLGSYTDGVYLEDSNLSSYYCFFESSNATLKDCVIHDIASFWKARKPTFINGEIHGEGSPSLKKHEGIAFRDADSPTVINSSIKIQGFVYAKKIRCVSPDISSIINPTSGTIVAYKIGEVVYRGPVDPSDTHIYAVRVDKGSKYATKIKPSDFKGEWTLENFDDRLHKLESKYG